MWRDMKISYNPDNKMYTKPVISVQETILASGDRYFSMIVYQDRARVEISISEALDISAGIIERAREIDNGKYDRSK